MDEYAANALQIQNKVNDRQMIPHLPEQVISFRSPHERLTRNVITEVNRAKLGHAAESYLKERWSFQLDDMSYAILTHPP